MLDAFSFSTAPCGSHFQELRARVRSFLAEETAAGRIDPARSTWTTFNAEFSRRCGDLGFIGMTWPRQFGGHDAGALERHAVCEEMIAGGAPLGAHWIADRQSGPQLLAHGSQELRAELLPRIAAGICFFGIGMSEPNVGSDLASVETRAVRVEGGWKIIGRKVWTTNADQIHYLIALVRTRPADETKRHDGLTQFVVDLRSPGVEVRPIVDLTGKRGFNEITFDEVFVPESHLLGEEGGGWKLVIGELAFERSGPDRFLSNTRLLMTAVDRLADGPSERAVESVGRLVGHLAALRSMSLSVAAQLSRGALPNAEAALVKDVGTKFEQQVPEMLRRIFPLDSAERPSEDDAFPELLGSNILSVTSHTLRGGTTEVLRSIIARELGLR